MNSRFHGLSIKQYSTTFLLVGSIASTAHLRADDDLFHVNSSTNTLKQTLIAEFSLAYGNIPTAIHDYTVLAIRNDSPTLKQRALNVALENNDQAAALDIARHWVEQEPEDVPALFYLSHIALKAHEYKLAAATLDKILTIDPNADLQEILAGINPETDTDRQSLLDTLYASKEKNNPSVLVLIAGLEAQNNQLDRALLTINQALNKRPNVTGFILLKANLLISKQDEQGAKKWFAYASKKHKDNLEVRLAEARYLIKINEADLALKKLDSIIQHWPKDEEAKFIAGLTAIDLKQDEKAEQYLLDLRDSAQYQNESYYYLAINAERKQHYDSAKAYYRLVDGNLYVVSRRNLVAIFDKQNKLDDALRFLTQERVNYPQHASFLYQLQAEILKKLGNNKAALHLLDAATKNIPDDPELLYAQVLLLDPFSNKDKLDKALKRLLQLEPHSPTYLNAYAYTLALQNRRLDEARSYAELALGYAPEQASILDTLGFIAFLQNDYATAADALGKAYALSNNVDIGIRYAKALYMLSAIDQFNKVLQELKQKHPGNSQLAQLDSLVLPKQPKKS